MLAVIPIFTIPQRHIGKWTQLCLILSILGFLVVTVVILSMCKEFAPVSRLLVFDGVSGWPDGVAWVMSVGNAMYAFASLDAITHVAEEMQHPGKEIPRVMSVCLGSFLKTAKAGLNPMLSGQSADASTLRNLTIIIGLVTGLPFIVAMMFVIKDVDAVRSAVLPSLEVFYQATDSKAAALGLQIILTILFYSTPSSFSPT